MGVGAFFSNLVMFFIILTTAITLNRHGITNIQTSRQAAEALRPFAGNFAATLFTLGIVGVGFLAIPTLAGSTSYAFAETLGWRQGLNKKLRQARWFYASDPGLDGSGRRAGLSSASTLSKRSTGPLSSMDCWLPSCWSQFSSLQRTRN